MSVSIVSISWILESGEEKFSASGILLDSRHILTADHGIKDQATETAYPIAVGLVPGQQGSLRAELVESCLGYDACVLRLVEGEATGQIVRPVLARNYVAGLIGRQVDVHAITPTHHSLHIDSAHAIGSYDASFGEYELTPQFAHGNSGGAIVHDGLFCALIRLNVKNEPLSRATSTHRFAAWLDALVPDLPRSEASTIGARVERNQPKIVADSPGRENLSHQIDTIHMHVDGARQEDFVQDLVAKHKAAGFLAEIASVAQFLAGPQRTGKNSNIYAVHTPGTEQREELDFFSTTLLLPAGAAPEKEALQRIAREANDVLVELDDKGDGASGVVVELERVVGCVIDGVAQVSDRPTLRDSEDALDGLLRNLLFSPFNDQEYPAAQATYEYHFSIDVPREAGIPPPDIEVLSELAEAAAIPIGGWFLFHDERRWAFRSNSFETKVSKEFLLQRWNALRAQLDAQKSVALRKARLRLLAEELLAVWRTPLVGDQENLMPVPRIARWERSRPQLGEFWVILPNFLGDRNARVTSAMIKNLKEEARYVYFLRSNADAKRWLDFKKYMVQRIPRAEELMSAYVVESQDPVFWTRNAAFIANPPKLERLEVRNGKPVLDENTSGIRLMRTDPITNQFIAGVVMHETKLVEIAEALRWVLRGGTLLKWQAVTSSSPPVTLLAASLSLRHAPSEEEFELLDTELANAASLETGEIVGYGNRSITIIFDDRNGNGLEHALRMALNVRTRMATLVALGLLAEGHDARFGIDVGQARKIVRAAGQMWVGALLTSSRKLLAAAPERSGIFLSPSVPAQNAAAFARLGLKAVPASESGLQEVIPF